LLEELKEELKENRKAATRPTLIHVQYGKTEFFIQGKSLAA
jgi:hypothetical protein